MRQFQAEDLNDDVVTEILLRLPSAAVLRARAVCKAWHRITTRPVFIAAHAGRRPLELIVQRHDGSDTLDTVPIATLDEAARRSLPVRYPEFPRRADDVIWRGYTLIASCDGLLLFERYACTGRDFFVCNPVTRQWTTLPRLPGTYTLPCGFYIHGPSGEHRVLCIVTNHQQGWHYVSSLEVAESRQVGPAFPLKRIWDDKPVACFNHRGKLHWLRHPQVLFSRDSLHRNTAKILVFDTVSETFRRMSRPPSDRRFEQLCLLEMEGMLAMTAVVNGAMDVWVLEDYNDDRSWARRHRVVDLPQPLLHACWAINADVEGRNVLLVGDRGRRTAGLYDLTQKRILKQFKLVTNDKENGTLLNALVFRDSLETHDFFNLQGPQHVHSPTHLSDAR